MPEKPQPNSSSTSSPHEEKKCLNCGEILHGHFCSRCGQRDEDLHEPFWKLFADAFADFWHFDSKFIHTIYPLVFKPGYLTKEYIAGKRARYVHPIRLYFFLSVLFFVTYFTFSFRNLINENQNLVIDSTAKNHLAKVQDSLTQALHNKNLSIDLFPEKIAHIDSASDSEGFIRQHLPATVELYEDSIRKLPRDSVPGYFQQIVDKKTIEAKQKGDKEVIREVFETANHNFPKIMFILLPIFAVLLKLLYMRSKVYFVDHAIFSLHFHSFAFITFLLGFSLMNIFPKLHLGTWIFLILLVYLFVALLKMHKQTIRKTLFKVFLLLISYSVFIAVAVLFLIIYSALTF